jgi:hypothetical protein
MNVHATHPAGIPMMRRCMLAFLLLGLAVGAGAAERVFNIRIENGRAPENMRFVRVNQGDVVKLRWSTDRAVTLHLHGYDIERRVTPGQIVEMIFEARVTGRFPVHVHAAGPTAGRPPREESALVYVEVYPR